MMYILELGIMLGLNAIGSKLNLGIYNYMRYYFLIVEDTMST